MGGPAFQLTVTRSTIDGRSRAGSIRRNVQTSPTHSITREVIALGLTKTTIGEQTSYLLLTWAPWRGTTTTGRRAIRTPLSA